MSLTTRFRERMAGPVVALNPCDAGPVRLEARGASVGEGLVEAARRASPMPGSSARGSRPTADAIPAAPLDLDGLVLSIDGRIDVADGLRAAVNGGTVTGIGAGADGPIVSGFADLLYRGPGAERRMYYRLVVGGADASGRDGWFVVEGIKVVAGSVWASWRQTTTLYARVSRLPRGLAGEGAVCRPDCPIDGVVPLSAGVLRIHPADLLRQVLSMRGGVPSFLARFFHRLIVRPALDASISSDGAGRPGRAG